jgi:hypothetical protein
MACLSRLILAGDLRLILVVAIAVGLVAIGLLGAGSWLFVPFPIPVPIQFVVLRVDRGRQVHRSIDIDVEGPAIRVDLHGRVRNLVGLRSWLGLVIDREDG